MSGDDPPNSHSSPSQDSSTSSSDQELLESGRQSSEREETATMQMYAEATPPFISAPVGSFRRGTPQQATTPSSACLPSHQTHQPRRAELNLRESAAFSGPISEVTGLPPYRHPSTGYHPSVAVPPSSYYRPGLLPQSSRHSPYDIATPNSSLNAYALPPLRVDERQYPRFEGYPTASSRPEGSSRQMPNMGQTSAIQQDEADENYPASPSRKFMCDLCPLSFSRHHDLRRHRETHSGEKKFACSKCGKSYTRKDALNRHQIVKNCGLA